MHQEQMQMQMAQQQAAAQAAQPQPPGGGGGGGGGTPPPGGGAGGGGDLSAGVDQLGQLLGKAENAGSQVRERLRAHISATNARIMDAWREEQKELISSLTDLVEMHKPRS